MKGGDAALCSRAGSQPTQTGAARGFERLLQDEIENTFEYTGKKET